MVVVVGRAELAAVVGRAELAAVVDLNRILQIKYVYCMYSFGYLPGVRL